MAGEAQDRVYRLDEGWACRYMLLPDGRRQITALYLPGDFCEPQWVLAGRAELPIVALTDVIATEIPLGSIGGDSDEGVSELTEALMTNFNRQSDWIVSLGRRSASGRIAALFAEIYNRLQRNGRVRQPCTIPLTQQDIADVWA
ncbi:Crp/Fnr family transcriptional regulator [Novosphingobium sp. 9U]|uniref:Crp/Fnr family transcriptional regulator n=1 Tax=Novosphingobium sp. 9U TaxID=2653158 RepID=UPI001357A634